MAIANAFNARGGTKYNSPISFEYPVEDVITKTINHRFDYRPNVIVIDGDGNMVYADIQYKTATQILINFAVSFTGTIILR